MKAREVRQTFLQYFQEQGHALIPSSPVIPHGDKTLLFTNAGMNQFKEIFTGKEKAKHPRATTAQKCIRAGGKHNDLDNVGYTTRHLTFFEMLGNFSFGDYFKREAIGYAWELVTRRFGISPERLWITVYREDEEARTLWREVAGVPADRIVGLGEADNFWSMGDVGPCGPCSEILVDRGPSHGSADIANGERFFEVWNLVFMQFDQKPDGTRGPLPRPSIDTGMGLERMAMVLQKVDSVFDTDVFQPIIRAVERITSAPYDSGPRGVPHRVLADHIRSLVFAFADGAEPSNEGRGYVLRRILRRAARYGRKIHGGGPILHGLVGEVVAEMKDAYPEVAAEEEYLTRIIRSEEERFGETLDKGIELFEDLAARLRARGSSVVPGDQVFKLYDTFGFPSDLVEQMAAEAGFTVDLAAFERLMEEQKERSRGASQFHAASGPSGELDLDRFPPTEFTGHSRTRARSEMQAGVEADGLWRVILAATPFYGEGGGQVGDTGLIEGGDFVLEVADTRKERGRFIHHCRLKTGDPARIRPGEPVEAIVDEVRRAAIERNHTATHLLHAALRKIAGTHVHQKGSLVEPARLRFDVTHFAPFKPEEIEGVEVLVREQILRNVRVEAFETDYEDAVKRGAMALFGEKYGDRVRVVKIGDFSLELCGGTHVDRTGEIGPFLVAGEGSVSAGVRRLEALTASGADALHQRNHSIVGGLSRLLRTGPESLVQRVERLLEENRELKIRPRSAAEGEGARGEADGGALRRERVGNVLFVSSISQGSDGKVLRESYDRVKKEAADLVAVLCAVAGGKVQLLVALSPSLVQAGWDAREIFRAGAASAGARGGGRPEMVQAGGTADPGAVERAVEEMLQAVRSRAS
jgi:alanyl-tRNA synthetase